MDKKRIQHLGLAAVLSIAMLGTTVPVTVLAATSTGTVTEKENALKQADEKLQTAKTELTKAQTNLDQAKANCDKAKTDYEDSLDAIETAKQNLEQAKKEKTDAEASVKNAQTEMTAAQAKYEQDLQKAKENLEAAQTAYDNVGIDFLNSVISNDSYKIANWKKLLANSSDDKVKNAYDETTFNEAFSVDNLLRVATLLDTCNNYRKSDNNFTEANNRVAMKLSPELVVSATASAMISRNQMAHVLFRTDDAEIDKINFPNATNWSENIAWRYSDPYDGWYVKEKKIYDNKEKGVTGHYTNIMEDYGTAPMTGIGISYGSTEYGVTHCQRFANRAVGKTYTSQEWRNAVNSFASDAKSKLDQATATKEKIEAKDSSAVKYYTDAETALQNAKSDLAEKEKAVEEAKKAYEDIVKAESPLEIRKVVLSKTLLTYNGKVQKPSVKVYDENGTQITEGFKVSYPSGCKNLGSYKVTVTGTDNYKGTVTASYVIRPAKCKTPSVKAGKKKMTVKWKKLGGGSQTYQIYVLKKGTKKAKYYTSTKTSKTIKKLAKKKIYSVKIRSYKKISGKTYYGAWSGTKKVKIK